MCTVLQRPCEVVLPGTRAVRRGGADRRPVNINGHQAARGCRACQGRLVIRGHPVTGAGTGICGGGQRNACRRCRGGGVHRKGPGRGRRTDIACGICRGGAYRMCTVLQRPCEVVLPGPRAVRRGGADRRPVNIDRHQAARGCRACQGRLGITGHPVTGAGTGICGGGQRNPCRDRWCGGVNHYRRASGNHTVYATERGHCANHMAALTQHTRRGK